MSLPVRISLRSQTTFPLVWFQDKESGNLNLGFPCQLQNLASYMARMCRLHVGCDDEVKRNVNTEPNSTCVYTSKNQGYHFTKFTKYSRTSII